MTIRFETPLDVTLDINDRRKYSFPKRDETRKQN